MVEKVNILSHTNVLRLARTLSEQSYWLYHQTHFIKSYEKTRERVIFEPYDKIIVLRDGFTKNWNSFLPYSRNTSIWAYDVGQYAKRKFAWNIIFVVKGYDEWKMGQENVRKFMEKLSALHHWHKTFLIFKSIIWGVKFRSFCLFQFDKTYVGMCHTLHGV